MALLNSSKIYCSSNKYAAVAAWAALTAYTAGQLVRQNAAPALGSERVFVCIVAGTSLASEPSWTVTKGAKTAEAAGPTWQEVTGQPPVNGDVTNTLAWTASAKNQSVVLGQIIKNDGATAYQICTTAGTCGNGAEPSFSTTAGTTTNDGTVVWTSLGVVGNFAAFAAPHQRILNADAATWQTVIGSTVYVGSSHAETQAAALTLTGGTGTPSLPTKYICVAESAAPPTTATTGATISTTGANALTLSNQFYWVGFKFSAAGGGANTANLAFTAAAAQYFENCIYELASTGASSFITSSRSNSQGILYFNNPSFLFGHASQALRFGSDVVINGGSIAATGTVPNAPFACATNTSQKTIVRACDLSALTGNLVLVATQNGGVISFSGCKLNASVGFITGSASLENAGSISVNLRNCDSGTKNYRFYQGSFLATMQEDTATYNNAGASDGTTNFSMKVVTTTKTDFNQPYITEEFPIEIWQENVGSPVTITVEIAGSGTLTNAEIWMEAGYLGSSSVPLATLVNNRATDIFATPTNVASSSASWAGSPAVTQKLQLTFTPQMKGLIKVRIFVAKPSTTVYIDPLITVV